MKQRTVELQETMKVISKKKIVHEEILCTARLWCPPGTSCPIGGPKRKEGQEAGKKKPIVGEEGPPVFGKKARGESKRPRKTLEKGRGV